MALVHRVVDPSEGGGGSLDALWQSDPDAANFNFDSIRNNDEATTETYSHGTLGDMVSMDFVGTGQDYFGGSFTASNSMRDALISADSIYMRYLIQYGTSTGQSWWDGTDIGYGIEWKAWDAANGIRRLLMLHKQGPSGSSNGTLWVRLYGSSGQTTIYPTSSGDPTDVNDMDDLFDSGNPYWYEAAVHSNGSVEVWTAPYTGNGNEYSEGSPYCSVGAGTHSWDIADWAGESIYFDYGFINHTHSASRPMIVHLAINDSFMGPVW